MGRHRQIDYEEPPKLSQEPFSRDSIMRSLFKGNWRLAPRRQTNKRQKKSVRRAGPALTITA